MRLDRECDLCCRLLLHLMEALINHEWDEVSGYALSLEDHTEEAHPKEQSHAPGS